MLSFAKKVYSRTRQLLRGGWRRIAGAYPAPLYVHIEINNTCNLDCVMCPRDTLKRRLILMDDRLYRNVIEQLARMGVRYAKLFLFGDPLVHPRLIELCSYAKQHGVAPILNTNALGLTEEKSRGLIEAGVETIIFSVDGISPEVYMEIRRGSNFELVRDNILRFLELNEQAGKPIGTVMQFAISTLNQHEVEPFREYWEGRVDRLNFTHVNEYGGIKDLKTYDFKSKNYHPCPDTWNKMVILADGTVTTCCLDLNGALALGDANQTPLRRIWWSKKWKRLRRDHRQRRFDRWPICVECPMLLLYSDNIEDQ